MMCDPRRTRVRRCWSFCRARTRRPRPLDDGIVKTSNARRRADDGSAPATPRASVTGRDHSPASFPRHEDHMVSSARGTLWAAILGSCIVFLDGSVVSVALPRIGQELPAHLLGVLEGQSYVYGGYLLAESALLILAGEIGRASCREGGESGGVGMAVQ